VESVEPVEPVETETGVTNTPTESSPATMP
jgi:hypothetical protein